LVAAAVGVGAMRVAALIERSFRWAVPWRLIRPVVGGLGISIMTTPKGLMSGRAARKAKIGGELLCEVW